MKMDEGIAMERPGDRLYRCGTLTYTKIGLLALFASLLWGDFCYTMMEAVVPSVLPLKLKSLGSPNWLIGVIMTTLPGILNMTICPWISFKSDRCRSRWGRRIPFIICTLPFLCVCLAALGFSDEIGEFLNRRVATFSECAPATVTIGLIAVLMLVFQFFNMFVGSVFFYLFNDVVPAQFLGRFMGLFKIIATGAGAAYNFFIFKYAGTHMREIFLGAAAVYLIGVGLMCLVVKEGEYPPLEGETDRDNKGWGGLRTFFKESFTIKFYWLRFLGTAFSAVAMATGAFTVFFYQEMGLDLDHVGKINAIHGIAVMSAMYFIAVFSDRWHPLRICAYGAVFGVIGYAINMVWIFATLPASHFFWLNIGNVAIAAFLEALVIVAGATSQMRIFPRSRYGQFCSAQALVRAAFMALAGVMAGVFIDFAKWIFSNSDFAYRFIYLWMTVFMAVAAVFKVAVYIQWNRMGGDKGFHPPAPWSPGGVEELPAVAVIGPQSKWLRVAICLYDAIMGLSTLSVIPLMAWMYSHNQAFAFKCYGFAILPLLLAACLVWRAERGRLLADMAAAAGGLAPKEGIPHHGVLIFVGCKFLLAFGIWVCQVASALSLGLENSAVAFGVAAAITCFLLIGALRVMRRAERGFSSSIDEKPSEIGAKS